MIKWVIIAAAVLAGIVFAVHFLIGYAGELGRDVVTLQDGSVIKVPLSHFKDDKFYYKRETDLTMTGIRRDEIKSIRFRTNQRNDLTRHELVTPDGKTRRCRLIHYSDGLLTVKDPKGIERTGKISEIDEIRIGN